MKDFLADLIDIPGVSGYEEKIAQRVAGEFAKYCPEVTIDPFYNVYGLMKGSGDCGRPRIMLAAHMDEIALMVKEIDDNGFLRFTNIGGVDPRVLLSQEVFVHGREKLFGVIAAKPPHIQDAEDMKKAVPMKDMCVDLGLPSEKVRELVWVGDLITFHSPLVSMQGQYVNGKSLDDRAGVVMLTEVMKELKHFNFAADVCFTATVQEEVGTRGAIISAYRMEPDVGIAIDVTHGDTPDAAKEVTSSMEKGFEVSVGPNMHPGLTKRFMDLAREYGIEFQVGAAPGPTGTDARSIQISRYGVPTLLIEMPLRYMHTTVETLNLDSVKKGARAIALFIASFKEGWQEWLNY